MPRTRPPFLLCSDQLRVPHQRLRLNLKVGREARKLIHDTICGLPDLFGSPICIRTLPELTVWRGALLTGEPYGTAVHAASFIRRREIVLEDELVSRPAEFRLIFAHELFHFVWARLGNRIRTDFSSLLQAERKLGATGALGESSDVSRTRIKRQPGGSIHPRRWADYACESFCDTGAWLYAGPTRSRWFTLARGHRSARRTWFERVASAGLRA